jgi:hypothetical protein
MYDSYLQKFKASCPKKILTYTAMVHKMHIS